MTRLRGARFMILSGWVLFDGKYFLLKYMLSDTDFDAGSENHVNFARKLHFNSLNLDIR